VQYAAFAVENVGATRVDSHERQLWELLVHERSGKPTYNALHQRENDLMGRNGALAFVAAQDRVKYYPERPDAWANLFFEERINLGEHSVGQLATHRARLEAFHQKWKTRRDTPYVIVEGLFSYMGQVTDTSESLGRNIRTRWRPDWLRMTDRDPGGYERAADRWWRINMIALKGVDSARYALLAAERYWQGAGHNLPMGARLGAQMARLANDSGAVRRTWLDRYATSYRTAAEYLYHEMALIPTLRRDAVYRLTVLVDELMVPSDTRRPLELSRQEAMTVDSARARVALGFIGDALLELGDSTNARTAYGRATNEGWNVSLFRKAALVQMAMRDSQRAVTNLAKVVIDPGTPPPQVDSLSREGRRIVGGARWNALTDSAENIMSHYFLASAERSMGIGAVTVQTAAGRAASLDEILGGRVSVVTFWSMTCAPSRVQTLALDTLAARLGRMNVTLVPVTTDVRTEVEAAYLRKAGVHTPVYYDRDGSAKRAFNQWATPEYYVLDATGRIRFRHSSMDVVLAQAKILTSSQ